MRFFEKKYDFIGIGDTVTDAFIELEDAEVERNDGLVKICMRFGDKIPYKDVNIIPAVGNSANASVSASRLGLKSAFVSNLGDDYYGQECLDVFKAEKVGANFIKINKNKKTNYHYVLLFQAERTILIKHQEYEYALPDIGSPKWVYLSSLGPKSLEFHSVIEKYLNEHQEIKLAFQPGTYQMKFGKDALKGIYKRADFFSCNKDEAKRILGMSEEDPKRLLKMIHDLGPKIVLMTDGKDGAYAYGGEKTWFMPPYPDPKPPINRTGAGDACSSTFVAALLFGKSIEEALMWGPINSMSVVQKIGARAGLLSMDGLKKYLAEAPTDYKPKLI